MRWAIEVRETRLPRRNLSDLLDQLGFTLVDAPPSMAFTSPGVDACRTPEEVFEIAKQVRGAFTGAASIDAEFKLGSVIDYSCAPLRRHGFAEGVLIANLQATLLAGAATVGPGPNLSEEQLRRWKASQEEAEYQAKLEQQLSKLVPVYRNPKAEKVLELLAIPNPTGEILFKIYELMRGSSSNGAVFGRQFGITDEEYRRFGDAVHHDSVSGDWARHAHGDPPKSASPMTKQEAESFVRAIANRWLEHVRATRGV